MAVIFVFVALAMLAGWPIILLSIFVLANIMAAMKVSAYSDFFKILSEPVRLRIIYLILERGELCVCDIVTALDLPQSVVSRHLAYMRSRGLVSARREGVWMHYQLALNHGFTGQILGLLQADARHQAEMKRDLARLTGADGCCN